MERQADTYTGDRKPEPGGLSYGHKKYAVGEPGLSQAVEPDECISCREEGFEEGQ